MLINLCKAVVAAAASAPLAVADVLTLPASAYDGRHPFHRARAALRTAGRALDVAIEPENTTKGGPQCQNP